MSEPGEPPAACSTAPEAFEPDPAVGELCLALFGVVKALGRAGGGGQEERGLLRSQALAPRHAAAVAYLALSGSMSVSTLAGRLGVARTTASLLVAELADAGLVDRREDADDHRRTIVAVSADKRSEVQRMIEARLVPLRRAAGRLGPTGVAELSAGLRVLAAELLRDVPSGADHGVTR